MIIIEDNIIIFKQERRQTYLRNIKIPPPPQWCYYYINFFFSTTTCMYVVTVSVVCENAHYSA